MGRGRRVSLRRDGAGRGSECGLGGYPARERRVELGPARFDSGAQRIGRHFPPLLSRHAHRVRPGDGSPGSVEIRTQLQSTHVLERDFSLESHPRSKEHDHKAWRLRPKPVEHPIAPGGVRSRLYRANTAVHPAGERQQVGFLRVEESRKVAHPKDSNQPPARPRRHGSPHECVEWLWQLLAQRNRASAACAG
jgi:hypothetical protein